MESTYNHKLVLIGDDKQKMYDDLNATVLLSLYAAIEVELQHVEEVE
jgi:hypothetical protein